MDISAFMALAMACAPAVHVDTARALVDVESAFNPWAIGVVGGALDRQPRNGAEALATAHALQANDRNFSIGLAQINVRNLRRLGLTLEAAFEPCVNLAAMQSLLIECFDRASTPRTGAGQRQLRQALSCYYSGDFSTGFRHGYVLKVIQAARDMKQSLSPPYFEGEDMNQSELTQRVLPILVPLATLAFQQAANAQGFDKVNTTVANVNAILATISIAVVTIAIIWAGFKMIFQGARLVDVANVLIGGTLIGGAGAMASYIVS